MALVEAIISTVRYGTNGYKHMGDQYQLPDDIAKEKADLGLVKILSLDSDKKTKELKDTIKTK
jgi:hypothetical protein